jgi:aspartate/methionine/tyrosine aminotransferase
VVQDLSDDPAGGSASASTHRADPPSNGSSRSLAAIAALEGPQEQSSNADEFRRRRAVIVKGLNELPGVRCLEPDGAFYVFPNITATGISSTVLADRLLQEAGVACLSGTAFGQYGEGYLRFSYANSLDNIQLALERIGGLLSNHPVAHL